MGYHTRPGTMGHTIQCFTPDNSDWELYIDASEHPTLREILERARAHFRAPQIDYDDLDITAEHLHTDCLGYDIYDSYDYTTYLLIKLNPKDPQ